VGQAAPRGRVGLQLRAHRAVVHEALVPHGDVAGEAAEGLAQRGDESNLMLPARCRVACHPVVIILVAPCLDVDPVPQRDPSVPQRGPSVPQRGPCLSSSFRGELACPPRVRCSHTRSDKMR
jgi:hypothetical protein